MFPLTCTCEMCSCRKLIHTAVSCRRHRRTFTQPRPRGRLTTCPARRRRDSRWLLERTLVLSKRTGFCIAARSRSRRHWSRLRRQSQRDDDTTSTQRSAAEHTMAKRVRVINISLIPDRPESPRPEPKPYGYYREDVQYMQLDSMSIGVR